MSGVDSDWNGSHGGHGLHQSALHTAGYVDESGVVDRVVRGVVATRLVVLEEEEEEEEEEDERDVTAPTQNSES